MRARFRITFDSNKLPGGAEAVLKQLGIKQAEETVGTFTAQRHIAVMLEETDPRLPALRKILSLHHAYVRELREDIYTNEDLDGARLLWMGPCEHDKIDGGIRWGTTYDVSTACPECGIGRRQTSAMFVEGKDLANLDGHRASSTILGQVLVDDGLALDLMNAGVTGMVIFEVYAVMPDERRIKIPWKQLTAARSLPRMSPRTTDLDRGPVFFEALCETCQRDGYNFTIQAGTPRMVYRASDLREADDVNATWEHEHFTELRESILSWPFMLVTPKVRRVFLAAGVATFHWYPIRVEETE